MSGRHPFSELTKDFTPERRRRIDEMKRELLAEMPLHELRRARALTQRDMAKVRISELKADPISALDAYEALLGWEMDLHKSLIERRRRQFATPSEAASDDVFLEDLHSIVKAWYGNRAWRVVPFDDSFKNEVRKAACKLEDLSGLHIANVDHDIDTVTCQLWKVIGNLTITNADAKIVSGTKAIHHLIPDLIPPMDNRYTGEFFLGRGIGQGGKTVFRRIYQSFSDLTRSLTCHEGFMGRVGRDFNTSVTKTVDNAIIGYMDKEDSQ